VSTLLTIGEFSRTTHLSVKALRHYHDVGLLEPARVDAGSGYRFYATAQVPIAHVIRRLRDLDMPLEEVRAVIEARDGGTRDAAIVAHLGRMEAQLERTHATVQSLRELLEGAATSVDVAFRSVAPTTSLAVRGMVSWDDTEAWLGTAFETLADVLSGSPVERTGPDSALYSEAFFEAHAGEVVAFVPITSVEIRGRAPTPAGVEQLAIPAAHLAVAVHRGSFDDLDQTYGALGTFVTERGIGAAGDVREHYLDTEASDGDPADARTEVCWPVRRDTR
jgi:DNA-binding transcriptional MerR regulator/effector-binding domain-containing protein